MNPSHPNAHRPFAEAPSQGFGLQDLYYTLFRHKWKILIFGFLGLAGAAAVLLTTQPEYTSEAQIFLRYIQDNRALSATDSTDVRSPDSRGDNIMSSEIAILTSYDLAVKVVADLGATNLVQDGRERSQLALTRAAEIAVRRGTRVDVVSPSVMRVTFTHPSPGIAQDALTNLIYHYLDKHASIHRGTDSVLELQTEAGVKERAVRDLEDELSSLYARLGVVSFAEDKTALIRSIANIQGEIFDTQSQIAEQAAIISAWAGTPALSNLSSDPSLASTTNAPPPEKVSAYRSLLENIQALRTKVQEYSLQFTTNSPILATYAQRLAEANDQRVRMEAEIPGLATAAVSSPMPWRSEGTQSSGIPGAPDPNVARVNLTALKAKLTELTDQANRMRANATLLSTNESEVIRLEQQLEAERKRLQRFNAAVEQAELDARFSGGRLDNITVSQSPTPAIPDPGTTFKTAGTLGFGGFAFGLALAFLLEMFVDNTVRRPVQVEKNLRLPLFLRIPRLRLMSPSRRRAKVARQVKLAKKKAAAGVGDPSLAVDYPIETDGDFGAYAEALRDRLMMYFQSNGLHHKPKLVGITSCNRGAGVTTIATSLAAALSETGDGNVLYVDVNAARGPSAQSFRHGRLKADVQEALEGETRAVAQVNQHLYMASLHQPPAGKVGVLPKTLATLVPKMKASDYDYIIFDLPPVTQISATSKVAGLMDATLMVLESEKTQTDLARKANGLLGESQAKVVTVLNKHRPYLPRRLDTDL